MDRRLKEFLLEQKQARKSRDVFYVCCFKCDDIVCRSEHIVLFGENRYTCIEPDFDDYILVPSIFLWCARFAESHRIVHTPAEPNTLGCARFTKILQNCEARQFFWKMYSIVFLAFTLKLPTQTLLSVAPTSSVFWCVTQFQQN